MPQSPQFAGSICGSMQTPPHASSPVVHGGASVVVACAPHPATASPASAASPMVTRHGATRIAPIVSLVGCAVVVDHQAQAGGQRVAERDALLARLERDDLLD